MEKEKISSFEIPKGSVILNEVETIGYDSYVYKLKSYVKFNGENLLHKQYEFMDLGLALKTYHRLIEELTCGK